MDQYAPSPPDDGLSTVTKEDVPPMTNDLQPLYTVNPLDESDQYGIDLFLRTLNVLRISYVCFAILRCTVLKGPVLYKAKKGIDSDIVFPINKRFHKSRTSKFYTSLKTYKKAQKNNTHKQCKFILRNRTIYGFLNQPFDIYGSRAQINVLQFR